MSRKWILFQGTVAKKPIFPIAIVSGAAKVEWERLKSERYFNKTEGDLDFLANTKLEAI